jgi:hypothetical protein
MKSLLTAAMYNLYLEGYSLEQIGKQFNVSRQSVYERFKKQKLQLRSKVNKPFILIDDLKFTINRDGYYECTTINRLMLHNYNWEKVNGKIPKGYELHHIDLNKLNNNVNNLLLVTPKEHAEIHSRLRKGSGMNKKVKCLETGEIFDSIVQVAKKHKQHASNVSRYYIDGKRKLNGFTYEKID